MHRRAGFIYHGAAPFFSCAGRARRCVVAESLLLPSGAEIVGIDFGIFGVCRVRGLVEGFLAFSNLRKEGNKDDEVVMKVLKKTQGIRVQFVDIYYFLTAMFDLAINFWSRVEFEKFSSEVRAICH